MKISHILCAALACTSLTFGARAIAPSEDCASPGRNSSTMARSADHRDLTHVGSGRIGGSKPRGAESVVAARGRLVRQPSHPVGSIRSLGVGRSYGVSPAGERHLNASRSAARATKNQMAIPRNSILGGPHAQAYGRRDGVGIRTAHNASIDGTQLRRPHQPRPSF